MVKRVIWSKKAIGELYHTMGYLRSEISVNSSEKFFNLVEKHIEEIQKHPTKADLNPSEKQSDLF